MPDPFKIEPPFVVSFSGGRTSGYMLHRIIRAHGGKLPEGCHILFCNTGKERPETLDFVHEVETKWAVKVTWLEYRRVNGKPAWEAVTYETASRKAEPFEAVIAARGFLPNRMMRFCTGELKIRTKIRYLKSLGLKGDTYRNAVGIRADEANRYARFSKCGEADAGAVTMPLYGAGVTEKDVMAFWATHPFDLQLKQHEGNCDLCFLKSQPKLLTIMRERPDLAEWWVAQEARFEGNAKFKNSDTFRPPTDRPRYSLLLAKAEGQCEITGPDDSEPCHGCTD